MGVLHGFQLNQVVSFYDNENGNIGFGIGRSLRDEGPLQHSFEAVFKNTLDFLGNGPVRPYVALRSISGRAFR